MGCVSGFDASSCDAGNYADTNPTATTDLLALAAGLLLLVCSFAPGVASAQSDYWFPGAIERLESGDIDNFPDPVEARSWMFMLRYGLDVSCDMSESDWVPSGVSEPAFRLRLAGYALGVTHTDFLVDGGLPRYPSMTLDGNLGLFDANTVVEQVGCDNILPFVQSISTLMYRYGAKSPNPPARTRFLAMANDRLLEELGVDEREVARFRPGYQSPRDLVEDRLVERVESGLDDTSGGVRPEDLDGAWSGTVRKPDGSEIPVQVSFWHARDMDQSNIRLNGEIPSWLPTIIYRGQERIETNRESTTGSNFIKLFVGVLSDDGRQLDGWLHHHAVGDDSFQLTLNREAETVYDEFRQAVARERHEQAYVMIEDVMRRAADGATLSEEQSRIFERRTTTPRQFGLKARDRGETELALSHFLRGIEWAPVKSLEQGYNYSLAGQILAEQGETEQALDALRKALSIYEAEGEGDSYGARDVRERLQVLEADFAQAEADTAPGASDSDSGSQEPQARAGNDVARQATSLSADEVCGGEIFAVAEQQPTLIGGMDNLQARMNQTEEMRSSGKRGRVIVQMVVDHEGRSLDAEIIRGMGEPFDSEALRLIRTAKYEPGRQRGEAVCVRYSLPVAFR